MSLQFARGAAKLLFATVSLLQLTPAVGADAEPAFSLVEAEITLDPGAATGRGALLLKGENLDDKTIGKQIEDAAGLDTGLVPTGFKFDVHDLDHTDKSRRWLLTTEVKDLPNNVTQKRYLTFRFDGKTETLPFTLTNKNPATFAWSVKAPAEISLPPGEPIQIDVTVQAVGATKIAVQETLLEQSQKRPAEGGWKLCNQRVTDLSTCKLEDLPPRARQQLFLYPATAGKLVGKYMGNVTVSAAEKADGDTLAMTVYGTTSERRIAGVVAIFIGVCLAWLVTVYLQNLLNRNQLLLPVAILRDRFRSLEHELGNKPEPAQTFLTPRTLGVIQASIAALSEARLEANGLLPTRIPNPFKSVTPNADAFKQFISDQSALLELLQQVIRDGFQEIWKQIPAVASLVQQTAINTAVNAVEDIATETPPPSAHDVQTRLQTIRTQLATSLGGGGAAALAARPRDADHISTEIRSLSRIAWLVLALVTTALGTYVLVLGNLGFGTCTDYLICLFWGFGLPVGGTQLAQATTATASTALGFSVPRPA
jgi:hypothetical protein